MNDMPDLSRNSLAALAARGLLVIGAVVWTLGCDNPRSPELCGTIPDQTIVVGETADLQTCFRDPNGEMLDFEAISSDPGVAAVLARGSTVTVTAVSPGAASVTVVATDPTGLNAQQSFRVIVPDRPPNAVGTIDDRELPVGDSATLEVAGYFSEPDGQALAYSASSSDPGRLAVAVQGSVVALVAVAKGTVAVVVTATDPGGLSATQRFSVKVPNRPPLPVDSIAAREVMVGGADTLDISPFFGDPDGDPLAYAVEVSDGAVVEATLFGSVVSLTGLAKGEATVAVTATDDEGLFATQGFRVTVPNRPPTATDSIPGRTLFRNEVDTVALARHFTDPDGDPLTWEAAAPDSGVVALGFAGSGDVLVVTALSQGETVVTVSATDAEGLTAEQGFPVTVPNRPPTATDSIPGRTLFGSEADTVALARHFSDPDADPLMWSAQVSDSGVVALQLSQNVGALAVIALSEGEATVSVTAHDPGGLSVRQTFTVTVVNRSPVATDAIPAQTLYKREMVPLDLTRHFSDPDGDALEYRVVSSDTLVATATASGTTLHLRTWATGETILAVTATDPGGLSVHQNFAVTVLNRAPFVATPIPPQTVFPRETESISLYAHFGDPDGDTLTYAAASSDPWVVRVRIDDGSVVLTAWATGTVEITVTATDPDGLAARQTLAVTVQNRAPVPVGTLPDLQLGRGDRLTLPIARYFRDPDGDALAYEASTTEPAIATATTRGGSVTLTGVSDGLTTLTLTATDPEGLAATQVSRITISGLGGDTPDPVGSIPPQTMAEGSERVLLVSAYFRDPNGDPLRYEAVTSDPAIATARVSGAALTLVGVATGQTILTVTATDPDGNPATQRTPVTVVGQGQPPIAVIPIPDQTVEAGQARTLSVADHFQDPDGGSLRFDAASSNSDIVLAALSGSDLTLTGVSVGSATVTVTATDRDDLSVAHRISVQVEPEGRSPVAVGTLPAVSVEAGGVNIINAAPYFRDPGGGALTYGAGTSDPGVAIASESGGVVTVRGLSAGATILTVTATNSAGLSASQSAQVEVASPPPGPEAVGTVPNDSIAFGDTITIAMAPYFTHPGGLALSYAAGTSSTGIAAVAMRRETVEVTGRGRGTATIRVIASDSNGRTAVQDFRVRVTKIDTGFEILLDLPLDMSSTLESTIRAAGAHWESILSKTEFPDVIVDQVLSCSVHDHPFEIDVGYVDDLVIAAAAAPIDGPGGVLASATICYVRSGTLEPHPLLGAMLYDVADLGRLSPSDLASTALHEIGHVLGIGLHSNWDAQMRRRVPGKPGQDWHFTGPLAIGAFDDAGGSGYSGGKVPVDGHAHWRESVLGTELMTPRLHRGEAHELSAITIQALADLGYRVNVGLADSYALPSQGVAADVAGKAVELRDDIYRGPVGVIGPDGNIVRVIPGAGGGQSSTRPPPAEAARPPGSAIRSGVGGRR